VSNSDTRVEQEWVVEWTYLFFPSKSRGGRHAVVHETAQSGWQVVSGCARTWWVPRVSSGWHLHLGGHTMHSVRSRWSPAASGGLGPEWPWLDLWDCDQTASSWEE
jgi:hypothetical protein